MRPIAAPNETPLAPLHMYFQVGLRWRAAPARTRAPDDAAAPAAAAAATPAAPRVAAAALVTVGNPGPEPTDTSSKDSQKLVYSALTGKLRLMLARGSRDVPTLWYAGFTLTRTVTRTRTGTRTVTRTVTRTRYAGFTLPLALAASASPLDVHSMYVHWHQRIASSVFCLAALPSQVTLSPSLTPEPTWLTLATPTLTPALTLTFTAGAAAAATTALAVAASRHQRHHLRVSTLTLT